MRRASGAFSGAGLLAACLALAAAGCQVGEDPPQQGEARIAFSAQPESLDPATAYSIEAGAILWPVYTSPLSYRHADGRRGTELVPALAEDLPSISRGGTRYRFRLRPGLKHSDGTPLRASDFERAVKRTLFLLSPGSKFFEAIVGAEGYIERKRPRADIPGIVADDATGAVRVDLERPDGTFRYALASAFAAPVAAGTPFERRSKDPPAGAGPYRFERVEPNRRIVLARNPHWANIPGIPRPQLDRITIEIVGSARRQAHDVTRGRLDFMFDPVPADLRGEIRREHGDRYEEFVSNSTYYFWLNSSIPPFDNPRLRQAVHIALDKPGLARLYGGLLEPTCNFLPPLMPGHRPLEPCPYGDPESGGDVEAARAILRREGALGTEVTVWGNTLAPTRTATEAFASRLESVGFEPKIEAVGPGIYFQTIGGDARNLHAGFANWFQEFAHPASFMAAVRGDLIRERGNYNFSHTDIPSLTAQIKRLQERPALTPAVLARWAAIDRAVVKDAGVVPFGHLRYTTFMSERMDFDRCSPNHPVYLTDFTRFCLR